MPYNPLVYALLGTGFAFFGTMCGSAVVYFAKDSVDIKVHKMFLGFASGVMISASFFSLLLPALETASKQGMTKWIPTVGGFLFGGLFLYAIDKLIPHLHSGAAKPEGLKSSLKRTTMLVLAVTLHNIPEGMAVGLSFALAAKGDSSVTIAGASALAIGMALQNFPEGAAISLPLKKEGMSKHKAFIYGTASGIVEPIAGVLGVLLAVTLVNIMPFILSFAAGAMIYVVIDELVPESYCEHSNLSTMAAIIGFALMMFLDIYLS